MSDTLILDAVKAFLKPIIAEAMQEASSTADIESIIAPAAGPAKPGEPQPEDTAATEASASKEPAATELSEEEKAEAKRREELAKYYTVDEIKAILHIGTTSVYNLFKRKKLTKLKVLGKTVVARGELDNAVESQDIYRYSHKK